MDLGGARDIEYIRKGISKLSVINYFMLSTAINLNDCNRVWIDKLQKIIYTPCSTLSRGGCHKSSLIFSSPVRHVFLPLMTYISSESWNPIKTCSYLEYFLQLTNTCTTNTTFELLKQWARPFYQDKRYMRVDSIQIPLQVVYVFYDVSGINNLNPFWM